MPEKYSQESCPLSLCLSQSHGISGGSGLETQVSRNHYYSTRVSQTTEVPVRRVRVGPVPNSGTRVQQDKCDDVGRPVQQTAPSPGFQGDDDPQWIPQTRHQAGRDVDRHCVCIHKRVKCAPSVAWFLVSGKFATSVEVPREARVALLALTPSQMAGGAAEHKITADTLLFWPQLDASAQMLLHLRQQDELTSIDRTSSSFRASHSTTTCHLQLLTHPLSLQAHRGRRQNPAGLRRFDPLKLFFFGGDRPELRGRDLSLAADEASPCGFDWGSYYQCSRPPSTTRPAPLAPGIVTFQRTLVVNVVPGASRALHQTALSASRVGQSALSRRPSPSMWAGVHPRHTAAGVPGKQ